MSPAVRPPERVGGGVAARAGVGRWLCLAALVGSGAFRYGLALAAPVGTNLGLGA